MVVTGPRGRQDLAYTVFFFFFFLSQKQISQCNASKILYLSRARVVLRGNKEAPRITINFIKLRMQLIYFSGLVKSKEEFWHGSSFSLIFPKLVIRADVAFFASHVVN